jgi:hypothetical protein
VLPSLNDEAIQSALDSVLSHGELKRVQMVRDILEPHQLRRWRETIGTLELTEKFENVVVSEKTIKTSKGGSDREETTRTFDRRKRDYEYTREDPRVRHLRLVAIIVKDKSKNGTKLNATKAKAYLLKAGMILEKSPADQAKEKVAEVRKRAADTAYHGATKIALGKKYKENLSTRKRDTFLTRRYSAQGRLLRNMKANRFPCRHINVRGLDVIVPRGRLLVACIGILIAASIIIATIIVAS